MHDPVTRSVSHGSYARSVQTGFAQPPCWGSATALGVRARAKLAAAASGQWVAANGDKSGRRHRSACWWRGAHA